MGETNYWQMASAVALGVAMISMSCTSFAAVYFMEDTIANKRAECDAFPVDEEVEARELKVQAKQVAYKHVTRWQNLPPVDRWLLGGSVLLMCSACHLAGNFGPYCFSTFTVTCTVALVDVVLPLGWVAMLSSARACFYSSFIRRARRLERKRSWKAPAPRTCREGAARRDSPDGGDTRLRNSGHGKRREASGVVVALYYNFSQADLHRRL